MRASEESVNALRTQARDLAGQLERMTGAISSVQKQVAEVTVTAVSRDELVRATVGNDGRLTDLHLDPRIYHQSDAAELARTILDTIAVAVDEARQRVKEICKPYVDGDSLDDYASGDFTRAMARFRQRLPQIGE